jgi:hypothetical protein
MADHAACSPSSAALWMNCPASITLAEGKVRPSSSYAREGTVAHRIAEMILSGDLFPPPKMTIEGQEFLVGRDMLLHLNPYIGLVQGLQGLGGDTRVEARVRLAGSDDRVWGTADCASRLKDTVDIVDLKYGKGVPVGPDSPQLKIYALSALDTFWPGEDIDYVRMTIVQPRLDPLPKTVTMHIDHLVDWRLDHLHPAVDRIVDGDVTEKVGPYCRWCVRRDECHAFAHMRSGNAADIFNDGVVDKVENIA